MEKDKFTVTSIGDGLAVGVDIANETELKIINEQAFLSRTFPVYAIPDKARYVLVGVEKGALVSADGYAIGVEMLLSIDGGQTFGGGVNLDGTSYPLQLNFTLGKESDPTMDGDSTVFLEMPPVPNRILKLTLGAKTEEDVGLYVKLYDADRNLIWQ
jgi:hypothetical protein